MLVSIYCPYKRNNLLLVRCYAGLIPTCRSHRQRGVHRSLTACSIDKVVLPHHFGEELHCIFCQAKYLRLAKRISKTHQILKRWLSRSTLPISYGFRCNSYLRSKRLLRHTDTVFRMLRSVSLNSIISPILSNLQNGFVFHGLTRASVCVSIRNTNKCLHK